MRKFIVFLLLFLCLLNCCPTAMAEESITANCSGLQATHALGSTEDHSCNAAAAILYELDTKTMAFSINPDAVMDPSGLVKLMSLLVAVEEGNAEDEVIVQQSTLESLPDGVKKIGLQAGDHLTVRDLMYCIMLTSANDAAVVLAEHIAGSQQAFVEKMNERAATAGCVNTSFVNAHGLQDASQHTTARDFAIIMTAALENETFTEIFESVNYQLPDSLSCSQTVFTTNEMQIVGGSNYDERVTGGKAVSASSREHSIVCTAKTEKGRYLCIVFSVPSNYGPFSTAKKLLNYGYQSFAVQKIMEAEPAYSMFDVKNGENSVVVGPGHGVYALLPVKYDPKSIHLVAVGDKKQLSAPISEGQSVGTLQICYGTTVVSEVELLARHSVLEKGTTIKAVETTGNSSIVLKVIRVIILVLLIGALAGAGALLIMRQVNINRYQKRKKQRILRERDRANELE